MIEVEGLSKQFGDKTAVDAVSFRAEKGEILGFLGPNGAGKTTTMRMLTCYLPPSAGTARIAGYDIMDRSLDVRRHIGYLPENVPLYRDLDVDDYLRFVGRLKGVPGFEINARVANVAEECGIADVVGQRIGTLSRGYRQRVGLAQALLNDPDVLILDEPTVGLDPRQIVEIRELIRALAGTRTVVLSTHILPEVSLLCQRVLIIHKGRLVGDDTPENLGRDVSQSVTIEVEVRGDENAARDTAASVAGVDHVEVSRGDAGGVVTLHVDTAAQSDPREALASALVAAGLGVRSLRARNVTLEDVFVHLVTEEPGDG